MIKLIVKKVKYVDKDGKEKIGNNFYVTRNGVDWVCIKPSFKDGYKKLTYMADEVSD